MITQKKFLSILACTLIAIGGITLFAQASNNLFYISPNNDGINDELTIPLSIRDTRYISEWALVIEDAEGNVVRTIGNKVALPESLTFSSFFKQLFTPKQGVDVPESVIWNGILDSGEVAPDGTYTYYVSASDDNGNKSRTPSYDIVVDNTEPTATLAQVSESAKIFGGSNKAEFPITQSGSIEDLWTGQIIDSAGNAVRTYTWKNSEPKNIEWDGKDDNNVAVAVGAYTYKLTATDRAGNINESAQINNIIYDAIPRAVNMMVQGSPFSPNNDGSKDTIDILPSMSTSAGLLSWEIDITDARGSSVFSFTGTDEPPQSINFDGKSINGNVLSDGNYKLTFTALFSNGQESIINRNITVDNTEPVAVVKADKTIFSPDGDGRLDTVTIRQEGSKEKAWTGTIINEANEVVKQWDFGEIPPESVEWNGVTDEGQIVDGFYKYVLSSTDLAGNTKEEQTTAIELNTGTTEVILTVSPDAFSPNGDRVKDILTFSPIIRTNTGVAEYNLSILDAQGAIVKTFSEKRSIPRSLEWNGLTDEGTRAPDGLYTASLYTLSNNGSETTVTTSAFELDSTFPVVTVSTPYTLFSPNNDGNKDEIPLSIQTSDEELWTATITADANKQVVKSLSWNIRVPGALFNWDGTDEAGNVVLDGSYTFTITSTDKAGNKVEASIENIEIDNRLATAYATIEYEAFSPNGDDILDTQTFTIRTSVSDGINDWSFVIMNADTNARVQEWNNNDQKDVPETIQWDGVGLDGRVAEGNLIANLTLQYEKGDIVSVSSSPFISTITAPMLSVQTAPEYFSPDNDGSDDDLFIRLQGQSLVPFTAWSFEIKDPQNNSSFWSTSGKASITERIIWDGRSNSGELVQSAVDYPYIFTVTDSVGMTSTVEGIIPVDVLVIRIGDVLKMQVPSIIFRSDNADFAGKDVDPQRGLDISVINNNERVLKRIAEILNKFRDYNVTIEGHANNISGTEAEETSTANGNIPLVPLSEDRAEYVKEVLVEYGINENRLSTVGRGGRVPVAALDDRENWWKNRRVEFILNK